MKLVSKIKNIYQTHSVILIALLYTCLFNSIIIFHKIELLQPSHSIIEFFNDYIQALSCVFILLIALSMNFIIFFIANILLFISGYIICYFVYFYNISVNNNALILIKQSHFAEAIGFFTLNFFIGLIVIITVIYLILTNLNKELLYKQFNNPAKFLSAVIIMYFVANTTSYIGQNYMPFNFIQTIINHSLVDDEGDSTQLHYDKEKIKFKEKDLNIVLIIGESARYDHFHINGYERKTSPYLDKIPNLISYQNVTSCWNFTFYAVPCLLIKQDFEPMPPIFKGISFIDVFNDLNFESFWFGNQGSYYKLDQPYLKIAKSSNTLILPSQDLLFNPNYDNTLLTYLDENILDSNANKLIIIHTKGSHADYEERYPLEFGKYSPNCKTTFLRKGVHHCTDDQIINSYDNTILYTDNFISEVIKRFESKNALIIYISDHGESLGEEGFYMHGTSSRPEEFHVPMFVWGSDQYIKSYQSNYKNLRSHYKEKLSYRNLFHTLLGCANINAPELIDNRLDLCSHY